MNPILVISLLVGLVALLPNAYSETMIQNFEGSMDMEITYPDEIIIGRESIISFFVKNNGWEDKQNISFVFSSQDNAIVTETTDSIVIDKLAQGGTYGISINLLVPNDTKPGTHFLNLKYSQILIVDNKIPQLPTFHDIAIPIIIKEDTDVVIYTKIPETIFSNAEFPMEVEIVSEDIDITDVNIKIITPTDIEFRGETFHKFSKIEKNVPVEITSRIIAPVKEVNREYNIPFEIIIEYTNDIGMEKIDSQTISTILRPRTLMELTSDGGIWIGNFFIAPYVSLGTIIGIPTGAIISLWIRKNQNSNKTYKKRKN